MSEKLEDPSKAAHEIIEVLEDGDAIRNDGVRLQAANKNPWYVLATIYGEQEEGATWFNHDKALAEKNRRAWNGWFCEGLSGEERADRAEKTGLEVAELMPLRNDVRPEMTKILRKRLNDETAKLPDRTESIVFSKTYFSRYINLEKYVFEKTCDFRSTTFSGDADFRSTTFSGNAYFSSAKFKSTTRFTDVLFYTAVPKFHATDLYDDTVFAARNQDLGNWPPLTGEVALEGVDEPVKVMPATDQKRAYNRLRLFMNRSLQIDEEQFFHRMEMRCKKEIANKIHTPLYWFYEKLSDYGSSVVRPVVGIGALIVMGAVLMLFHLEMGQPATGAQFWTSTGWSISNTLPFLGFGKLHYGWKFALELPVWLKFVGGVQTLFGFILLFLFGLGLRNRFRLR